jgi:hypothetical protein
MIHSEHSSSIYQHYVLFTVVEIMREKHRRFAYYAHLYLWICFLFVLFLEINSVTVSFQFAFVAVIIIEK